MGEVIDLDRIMQEKRLAELKEDLPEISIALHQAMLALREDVDLDHRFKGALGLRTTKSLNADGIEVEYTLENLSLSAIRKIVALRFRGYDITQDIPKQEMGPYLISAMEVFLTESGSPVKTFTAAPEGLTDTIGFYQDVVPMVFVNQNPNLVTNFGGL